MKDIVNGVSVFITFIVGTIITLIAFYLCYWLFMRWLYPLAWFIWKITIGVSVR